MKTLIILAFILIALLTVLSNGQTSNIAYNAGTTIDVGAGADICADAIIINGTYTGGGTICSGALPVSLSSFTFGIVNKRDVMLSWVTEWEVNNSGFDIERKKSGNEGIWQKTGFVTGSGTTNEPKMYSYKDEKLSAGKYEYRLKQVDFNGGYEYFSLADAVDISPPKNFELGQNYPNPGNPKSKINFELPVEGRVTIKIYDITGREVITLLDEIRKADYYTIEFNGINLASGVYFYRIESGIYKDTKKMILVK